MRGILLLFLVSALLVFEINAFCCSKHGVFECCSWGPCNIFCCNCDGVSCKPDKDCDPIELGSPKRIRPRWRGKRAEDFAFASSKDAYNNTLRQFMSIDRNSDKVIDLGEFEDFAAKNIAESRTKKDVTSEGSINHAESLRQAFKDLDNNQNGFIDPSEFDGSLV